MQLLSNLLWLLPLGLTCQDFHDSCAAWAKHGECEQNPAYMKARMDPQPAVEPGFLSRWMLPTLFQCPWCPLVSQVQCAMACNSCDWFTSRCLSRESMQGIAADVASRALRNAAGVAPGVRVLADAWKVLGIGLFIPS